MRMSLLKQREPLGDILSATLSKFWSQQFRNETHVQWNPSSVHPKAQTWLVNDLLNCIYRPGTSRESFEPIRAEYGSSVHRWRTPLQRSYVYFATQTACNRWLASDRMLVHPPIPESPECLIIPGNAKLRILELESRMVWVVHKEGFPVESYHAELAHRQRAAELGVPIPSILDGSTGHAFCEEYIVGIPANRIAALQQEKFTQRGYEAIRKFMTPSLSSMKTADYLHKTLGDLNCQLNNLDCVSSIERSRIESCRARLNRAIEDAGGHHVDVADTHGDFQPGNLLIQGDDFWIIDWEYAGKRMAHYDPLVMALAARFSMGFTNRVRQFVDRGPASARDGWPRSWPVDWPDSREGRQRIVWCFLLEELLLHVKENACGPIQQAGRGLVTFVESLEQILKDSD